ncbi:hypothetical protein [Streptomyces tateyamensis]|uniref:hypothetical protein n=1 Tax=Streptomyces tateyamensis TaxID=565073 RepID=UPI0015E8E2A6|nr:hypothetical protein [Streptomyces tateyamensis]
MVRVLLTTPDPILFSRVRELWEAMRLIALAGYGLFVLAAGVTAMTHGSVQQRWSAADLLPRLVLGIAASNLSLTFCSMSLELANAISAAIFGNGVSADDVAGTLIGLFLAQLTGTAAPYMLVLQLVALTLGATLLVTVLVRTAAIIILTIASPLMLACHGHPASDGIARLWWRAYLGCLGTEIAQAIAFLVCVKVLLDPNNYGLVPIPSATSLINLMLICCTLYLLIKIPSWIRRIVTTPARTITGNTGPRMPGLRILRKVAIGALLGMPLGPYAFGAQLAGRLRTARTAGRPATAGTNMTGVPQYWWGRPRRNGPGRGGPGAAPPPSGGPTGGGGPSGGPGGPSAGGSGAPPPAAGGPGSGPGGPAAPSYQWGRPRRRTAGNRFGAAPAPVNRLSGGRRPGGSTDQGLPPEPSGRPPKPAGPGGRPTLPQLGTASGARRTPPPPAVRPTAASNLRPARANLPPPIPRPAPLRPPLDTDPPAARRNRRTK